MKMTKIEYIIIAVIVLIVALILLGASGQADEKAAFIASCSAKEDRYQCEYKWKQMHPDPLIIFAPLNR